MCASDVGLPPTTNGVLNKVKQEGGGGGADLTNLKRMIIGPDWKN